MTTLQIPEPDLFDTGIVLGAYPSDTDWDIEWQRAPDDGGGNPDVANAERLTVVPASVRRVVDREPDDGLRRHYRWRHVRGDCSTPSAWSGWVDDIPGTIPDPLPPIPPLDLTVVIEKDHQESDFDGDNIVEGRLTLEVIEQRRKWDIDFFTRQGRGTSFTTGTSFTDQVEGDTPTQDVELVEKLNSWILYQVTAAGGNVVVQAAVVSFDPDEIAEVLAFSGFADASGNVLIAGRADTDTAKVHVTITTDGTEPADPTAANSDFTIPDDATATDARKWLNEDTLIDASPGDDVRMKARGENSAGVLAPAEHINPHDFNVPDPSGAEGIVADEILSESIVSGVLTGELELFFFTGNDTYTVRFWDDNGPNPNLKGTVSATVTGRSPGGLNLATHTIALVEKFNSFIRYEIENESTNEIIQVGTIAFDPDRIPEVSVTAITIDPDTGDVEFSYAGDSDVDEIRYTSNVGSAPADPTTGSSSFVGRANTGVGPIGTLALNEIVFLKVAGYNSSTGKIGPIAEAEKQREANPKEDQSKVLQISMGDYTDAVPSANNANGTQISAGVLFDNVESDNLAVNGWIPVNLPVGVTLTGWNFDYKQESNTNGDDVVIQLFEQDNAGGNTLLDQVDPTVDTGSVFTNASSVLNDTLASDKSYVIFLIVDSRTANQAASIARIEIEYDAPRSVENTL